MDITLSMPLNQRTKSYNGNDGKGEMGKGVLGVLMLHRRSEKILLLCLGFF